MLFVTYCFSCITSSSISSHAKKLLLLLMVFRGCFFSKLLLLFSKHSQSTWPNKNKMNNMKNKNHNQVEMGNNIQTHIRGYAWEVSLFLFVGLGGFCSCFLFVGLEVSSLFQTTSVLLLLADISELCTYFAISRLWIQCPVLVAVSAFVFLWHRWGQRYVALV